MNYILVIAYDGSRYHGWQAQPHAVTVAGTLAETYYSIFRRPLHLLGASRTDAGVHALGQVAYAKTTLDIDPNMLVRIWNNHLPKDIVIRHIMKAPVSFYPRHNVVAKTYYYHIFIERPLPFFASYGIFYEGLLNEDRLKEALELFVGTHDFRAFCTGIGYRTTVRTIDTITCAYNSRLRAYRIKIVGHSFMHHMIRRIVGAALLYAGKPTTSLQIIRTALESATIHYELPTAPSQGLMLARIVYNTVTLPYDENYEFF